jgi:hypothetical protein
MSAQRKRKASRAPVLFGRVDRLIATTQRKLIANIAITPIQKVVSVGEKVRLEILKFKILNSKHYILNREVMWVVVIVSIDDF